MCSHCSCENSHNFPSPLLHPFMCVHKSYMTSSSVLLHPTELLSQYEYLPTAGSMKLQYIFHVSPAVSLCRSLCPLGVPLTEAPGSVDQGSLPASRSVCTLGRDGPAPQLVLALRLHLSQWLPHCSAAVLRSTAQRESSYIKKDIYVLKHYIRINSSFVFLVIDGHVFLKFIQ